MVAYLKEVKLRHIWEAIMTKQFDVSMVGISTALRSVRRARALGAISLLAALPGCGSSTERETPQTTPPASGEYPLSPDDPRAILEPEYLNVPEDTAPHRAASSAANVPTDESGITYDVATGEVRTLNDAQPSAGAPSSAASGPEYRGSIDAALTQAKDSTVGKAEQAMVLPPDSRQPISDTLAWPWRANVKQYATWPNGSQSGCSGTIVSSKYVLTAGHCVYNHGRGGWATSIRVIPALNGTYMPFGDAWSANLVSNKGWVNNDASDCDYGMIVLDRRVGNVTGWTGFNVWNSNSGQFRLAGYPEDKGYIWPYYGYGTVQWANSQELWHQADTYEGQSGGGMAQYAYSNQIRAINAEENCWYPTNAGPYGPYNCGPRINDERSNLIYDWVTQYDGTWEHQGDQTYWLNGDGWTNYTPTMVNIQNHWYDMFLHGSNNQVLYSYADQTTGIVQPVTNLGLSSVIGRVAAVSRGMNLIDIFATSSNRNVYTKAWNGSGWVPSQTDWWSLGGGDIAGEPTVVSWSQDRIDVFARSTSGVPKHIRWIPSAGWSQWESLGGLMTGTLAAVSRDPGIIDVYIRGTDGHLWGKAWWEGTGWLPNQTGWYDMGGSLADSPVASALYGSGQLGHEQIDVYARWTDDNIHVISWPGTSWGPWTSLDGLTTAQPATYARAYPRIVFVRGTDGAIYYKRAWSSSGGFEAGWQWLRGDLYDVATTGDMQKIVVAGRGPDNSIDFRYYYLGQWNQ
jgi:V8-like Glu-specific endopeptidase